MSHRAIINSSYVYHSSLVKMSYFIRRMNCLDDIKENAFFLFSWSASLLTRHCGEAYFRRQMLHCSSEKNKLYLISSVVVLFSGRAKKVVRKQHSGCRNKQIGQIYTRNGWCVWTNLGKKKIVCLIIRLCTNVVKRRIIREDELYAWFFYTHKLSCEIRLEND